MDGESGDEGNDEVVWVCEGEVGEVHLGVDSRDRVMHDEKNGCLQHYNNAFHNYRNNDQIDKLNGLRNYW